jgi:hypothetical protein
MESDSWDIIMGIFDAAQVNVCFLPTYLPEFDAAEYIFHEVKEHVRKHRSHKDASFYLDIIQSLATIMKEVMWGFYKKSFFGWTKEIHL